MRTKEEIRKQIQDAYNAELSSEEIIIMHTGLSVELLLNIRDLLNKDNLNKDE